MNSKKLKALFITHDISNYGASRSLQLLLNNYQDARIDLVANKDFFRKDPGLENIRSRFGTHVENFVQLYLPYDLCYKYKPDNSWKLLLHKIMYRLLWHFNKIKLYAFISKGGYDFIHLNSLILHPVITAEYPFVLHMRDIYDGSNADAVLNIQKARGVIFIDEATKAPFRNVPLPASIVLNNPFDMTPLRDYADRSFIWPEADFKDKVVFSIIGLISAEKGTDFIIRSFIKLKNDNARLLIVGRGDKEYMTFCKSLSQNDKRIIFWGEEPDILKIYSVSDYILRGEPYQCVGRTIYEGLYGGCHVIIPGEDQAVHKIFEYDRFKKSIHLYRPRNDNDLLELFNILSRVKVSNRQYSSNVADYVREFHAFVSRAVCRRGSN